MALSLQCAVEPLGAPAGTRASGGSANGPSIVGGLSAREDLRVGLARIGDWVRSEASTMLDREALCRIEARCLVELADQQELVPKVWDVPEPPTGAPQLGGSSKPGRLAVCFGAVAAVCWARLEQDGGAPFPLALWAGRKGREGAHHGPPVGRLAATTLTLPAASPLV